MCSTIPCWVFLVTVVNFCSEAKLFPHVPIIHTLSVQTRLWRKTAWMLIIIYNILMIVIIGIDNIIIIMYNMYNNYVWLMWCFSFCCLEHLALYIAWKQKQLLMTIIIWITYITWIIMIYFICCFSFGRLERLTHYIA